MQRTHWVLIGILAVVVIVVLFIWLAKPTLVLPPVTITVPESSPLNAITRRMNNDLQVKVRTDGKAFVTSAGTELGEVAYTPATLANTLRIAEKALVPPETSRNIRVIPLIFPRETMNALATGLALYYFLPVETTFRIIPG
jgi:hypothetical protein